MIHTCLLIYTLVFLDGHKEVHRLTDSCHMMSQYIKDLTTLEFIHSMQNGTVSEVELIQVCNLNKEVIIK